jgi:hypothetical protein
MNSRGENPDLVSQNSGARDLTCGSSGIFLWCLPALALIAGLHWTAALKWLWIPAFLIMGLGCLANASRCGRLHCYISGPVLLLAAVYVVLASFLAVPFSPGILLDAVVGVVILAYLAEIPFGKYHART